MTAESRRPIHLLLAGGIVVAMIVGGCATEPGAGPVSAPTSPSAHGSSGSAGPGHGSGLPSQHVHGVARNPADDRVYIATHDGLFRIGAEAGPTRIGPVIDLMGFTVAGPNHFYASGHPGVGVDLPNPVGLIESRNGGQAWTPLSRQGQSDFHTLTSSRAGIVGFDGEQLAVTSDGHTWQQLVPPVPSHAAAASPDGQVLLVTSESGAVRSRDGGKTWEKVQTPLLLQLAAWADTKNVVGIAPDGRVATSADAAATWQLRGSVGAAPHALGAGRTKEGGMEVLAVTAAGLVRSTDNAESFSPFSGG